MFTGCRSETSIILTIITDHLLGAYGSLYSVTSESLIESSSFEPTQLDFAYRLVSFPNTDGHYKEQSSISNFDSFHDCSFA